MKSLNILVVGALVNSIGTGMTAFTLAVYLYSTYGTATAVALVNLCALGPIVLLAPIAGVLADRHDRRLMMMIGDGASIVGLAIVFFALQQSTVSPIPIVLGVTASSTCAALTEPALRASVTDLVTEELYQRASGLLQLASSAKFLLSPVMAGLLLNVVSPSAIVLFDAGTCIFTVACAAIVRQLTPNPSFRLEEPASFLSDFARGWAAIVKVSNVRYLAVLMTMVTFFLGVIQTLAKPILLPHMDSAMLGIVETVLASGLIVGAVLMSVLPSVRPNTLIAGGLAVSGLAIILFSIRPSFLWVSVWGAIFFVGLSFCNAGAEVLVRSNTSNEVQARVWGVMSFLTQSGFLAAYVVAGPLTDKVFEPNVSVNGAWADTIGLVLGTGQGRGAAALTAIMGVMILAIAALSHLFRSRFGAVEPRRVTS